MMRVISAFIALCLSAQAYGLTCPEGRPVGGHIGVPVDTGALVPLPESGPVQPFYELLRVGVAWLPEINRHRDQEVVNVDWKARTHTQVDLWDGELRLIREFGIREVELLDSSNFETGHLDIRFCMPGWDRTRGLVFAYYGANDAIDRVFVAPFGYRHLVPEGLWFTTVIDAETSSLVADQFNQSTVFEVAEDVEATTGVPSPRYLAESLIQQNLQPMTDLVMQDHAPFFDAVNARIDGNQVIVLGDDASVSVTHGVKSVRRNGQDIRDGDYRIRNLENFIGAITYDWHSTPRLAHIVDGRAGSDVTATACTEGVSRITGSFLSGSPLLPLWRVEEHYLFSDSDAGIEEWRDREFEYRTGSIDFEASCESDFRITASSQLGAAREFLVQYTNPEPWISRFDYSFDNHTGWQVPWGVASDPGSDVVTRVWDVTDIALLEGLSHYRCTSPGGADIDSIDEIVDRALSFLNDDELGELALSRDDAMVIDDDGDGSVCNAEETALGTPPGGYIYHMRLAVRRNLGHPDFLTGN